MYANIIGMQFAAGHATLALLPSESPVHLVREPSNPYDPNAIQVWAERKLFPEDHPIKESALRGEFVRLGYIRREQAAEFAPELDRREFSLCHGKFLMETLVEFEYPQWVVSNGDDVEWFETKAEAEDFVDHNNPSWIIEPRGGE